MSKLTQLTELTVVANVDLFMVVDISDTSMDATGTNKYITWASILSSTKTYTDTLYATIGSLASYVPYTGATTNVDLGANTLSAQSLTVNGTNGAGHIHLKHQASDATAISSSTVVFADSNGDIKQKINGNFYATFKTSTNTADRVYTFPDATTTIVGTDTTQSLTNKKLGSLTTNGFVKTSGGDGTLSVDTNTYLTSTSISDTAYGAGWNGDTTTAPSKNAVYDQMELRYKSGDSPSFATVTTSGNIELGHASDTTLSRAGAGDLAVEGVSVLTTSNTKTFSNKRHTPRVYTASSNTSLTPEIDTYDVFHITALAGAITINNHSTSTPTDGELMRIRLLDNGTARAISFGTNYVAKAGVALPTTTVLSKNLVMLFEWNANLSKWNLLASGQEA